MRHKYGIGDIVYSTIWNEDVRITKLNDNLFYTVHSINRYDWMMTHEGNLKSREDVIEKMMQEHQDVCNEILTIQGIDTSEFEMIEGLVEEEVDLIPKFGEYGDNEPLDVPTMTTEFVKEHGLPCPEDYIFKDENGIVIDTHKIVLEKKKEYPKTYKECLHELNIHEAVAVCGWEKEIKALRTLLICRDAYWKIAGEEMGLGKPWKPDWENSVERRYSIVNIEGDINLPEKTLTKWILKVTNKILVFPTEEMRDAFYENFKKEIEICKELL